MVRPTLIDANLLVLLVVGDTDPSFIAQHKRLGAFGREDHRLLRNLLKRSGPLAFVPHVLAETSNLLRQSTEPRRARFAAELARLIVRFEEAGVRSAEGVGEPVYARLGLTDAVLLHAARSAARIVTVDLDLFVAAAGAGVDCVNFNHVRAASRA